MDIDQLVDGFRINRRLYTEARIFELEMERIFGRTWVFLCHESEIDQPGDYRTALIGTQPVIVARDDNGEINVLMNHCMHRGATVCQERRGNASHFRCWYHGWTYDNRGDLTGVTWADGYGPGFDKRKHSLLRAARVQKYRGLVFASLSEEGESLSDYLAGAKRYLDVFMDLSPVGEIEAKAGGHRFVYDGNWKFQMENGVDGYHPNFVHRSFLQTQPKAIMDIFIGPSAGVTRDLGNGHAILDMSPLVRASNGKGSRGDLLDAFASGLKPPLTDDDHAQLLKAWGPERTAHVIEQANVNLAVFPNLLIVGVQLRAITPISLNQTEVYQQPTLLKGVSEEMNLARLRSHEAFYGPGGNGAPDDVEMFARCTLGMRVKGREWIEFDRGVHRERLENGERIGQITDEIPQRAFYRRWRQLMIEATSVRGAAKSDSARPDIHAA